MAALGEGSEKAVDEDGELDEDWIRREESETGRDWGLTGISDPSHWPSDVGRREIGEDRREDQSFAGGGGEQKGQSTSMTGEATVRWRRERAEAVTRIVWEGGRNERQEKPSRMRGRTGAKLRYSFYRILGRWEMPGE